MQHIKTPLPERLHEEGLDVLVAWAKDVPEKYIYQIIKNSRQPHVMKYEGHEDVEGRFKDLSAYRQWAEKDRVVYLLVHKESDEVGGIIWFGERHNELIDKSYNLTFGIRLYEGCVGKGLAVPFMGVTHSDVESFFPKRVLWLDFAEDNIAARKAYESFGYSVVAEGGGRVVMGYHREDHA